ncbi:Zinc-finger of nitric oxide synthase-interacting protein [Phytophthora infestans]|uniref:Zinc-finger of nitric oxide synthase-interacting protein n=1 Tax=Phytophthora infestans TaxID=4787 RepID=A0A833W8L2_PHYIN|nr:Zinc-finger of nitric oxide synthase-interacting protein [Phytophthora infestans]
MSRHSKNATATTHFTYRERVAAGHGTLKRRFGRDSQLSFGVCCLCLATTHSRSPLVSPGGFVYCKECIYSNLLAQKRSIQENVAAYERFMETQDRKQQDEVLQKERETLQKALNAAEGAISGKATRTLDQARALATQKLKEKVDRATDDDKREAMKKTSFWIPDCTPTQETKVDKPDTKTRDPMSLDEMKLKHLMPVKFEWDTSAADGKPKVLCAVTKKEISHHRAVLLRPSGQVILESCLKDMVLPTMTCPVTGLKLRKKDIVYLQAGGTGFSAHSTVEAKKYRPTMT